MPRVIGTLRQSPPADPYVTITYKTHRFLIVFLPAFGPAYEPANFGSGRIKSIRCVKGAKSVPSSNLRFRQVQSLKDYRLVIGEGHQAQQPYASGQESCD